MSYIRGNHPYYNGDEEEVGDDEFLRSGRNNYSDDPKDRLQHILDEGKRVQERSLQSTKTTLGLIYETEKIGMGTAEELIHQREQLENVDQKLDAINSVMRVSQKHITSMKSMFGGLKNYFSKDKNGVLPAKPGEPTKMKSSTSENVLSKTINNLKVDGDQASQSTHPRLKSLETASSEGSSRNNMSSIDKQLDSNLMEIGAGVGRLKELALGLGTEIDSQNSLLDRIGTKADRSQDTIANQNRQMKRILK